MGIKGLLPFLKSITKEISLKDIRGSIVAVDTYSWLHKSAISCSDKLALGVDTDIYLNYCLRYIKLLLVYDIKVILVFDGKNLPAKLGVENKRHESRESYRKKGLQFTLERKLSEAKDCFDKCIDISHNLAVKLIKEAHSLGVKSIVAPYEADAQLAYLGKHFLVDYIITEDSDLLLFGAPKVLFKLDFNGNAHLIEKNDINKALKFPLEKYSYDKFRYICIMAGCDYFPGINGIGLITAAKMVQKAQLIGLSDFLMRINIYSKNKIQISKDEITQAVNADLTFQYQIVFDPVKCEQVPLNDYPVGIITSNLEFAGKRLDDRALVFQLATGQRDPSTHELVPNYGININNSFSTQSFFDLIKRKIEKVISVEKVAKQKALTRGKSLQVKCNFPWNNISKSCEALINMDKISNCYTQDKDNNDSINVNMKHNNDYNNNDNDDEEEVTNLLNGILSKEEMVVKHDINDKNKNPFVNDPIIRLKRSSSINNENMSPDKNDNSFKKPRLLKSVYQERLSNRKILVQSKLSHLFKKDNQDN